MTETALPGLRLLRRGKVRDVYEVDEGHLLVVATDRISAFDCILPTRIERKGEVLTALSRFWFGRLAHASPHHLVTTEVGAMPEAVRAHADSCAADRGRARAEVFPARRRARYLVGRWKEYQRTERTAATACGGCARTSSCGADLSPRAKARRGTTTTSASQACARSRRRSHGEMRERRCALREAELYARGRVSYRDTRSSSAANGMARAAGTSVDARLSRFWSQTPTAPGPQRPSPNSASRHREPSRGTRDRPPLVPPTCGGTTARYLKLQVSRGSAVV